MASKDLQMSKHGTAGKRQHVPLTIPQQLKIIRKLENGESQGAVKASYNTGLYLRYGETEGTIMIAYGSK
jgi:hypothetical protein